MNYLAHIYLARQSDAAMVGALLGDFAKADIRGKFPGEIEREILLHRQIDRYTDNHPLFKAAVQRFAEGRRRYAGIALDVFYDHLLSQRWAQYADTPRPAFIAHFYQALLAHRPILPERLRDIAPWMVEQDWLGSYHEFAGVESAINRVSQRLSRNGHLLRASLADLALHYDGLAQDFDLFFPELILFTEQQRSQLQQAADPDHAGEATASQPR
ncbi:acyl carrier protein phosphodiesterase [Chitinimonas naiadis]